MCACCGDGGGGCGREGMGGHHVDFTPWHHLGFAIRKLSHGNPKAFEYQLQPSPLTFVAKEPQLIAKQIKRFQLVSLCWNFLSLVKRHYSCCFHWAKYGLCGAMVALVCTDQHSCPTICSHSNDIMLLVTSYTMYWLLCTIKWKCDSFLHAYQIYRLFTVKNRVFYLHL